MAMVPHAPTAPIDALTEQWRVAHRAAVRHLVEASWSECGCTALVLCDVGQLLDDRAADAERRLALLPYLDSWYVLGHVQQRNRSMMLQLDDVTAVTISPEIESGVQR